MKPQLFILHHAGGNSYAFQFLLPHVTGHFDVIALDLPGRGKRATEPLVRTKPEAISDQAREILRRLNGQPFLLYGHSLGAVLMPHVVHLLGEAGKQPLAVVVSGCPYPLVPAGLNRHSMPPEELADALRQMGGIPEEYFQSPELIEYFEPIIRADFSIAETETTAAEVPVMHVPVYATIGTHEYETENVGRWKEFTTAECRHQTFEGGHFFIHNHPAALGAIIKECYDRYLVHQNG